MNPGLLSAIQSALSRHGVVDPSLASDLAHAFEDHYWLHVAEDDTAIIAVSKAPEEPA